MIQYNFHDNFAYKLYKTEKMTCRGYFEYGDTFFHGVNGYSDNLYNIISELTTEEYCNINGNFFIIFERDNKVFVLADRISSFPIYYYYEKDVLVVSDILPSNKMISHDSVDTLLSCGFVTGNKTVYEGVYQLQAGQFLTYDITSDTFECSDYYLHIHKTIMNRTIDEWIYELRKTVKRTTDIMIDRVAGRQIALFLSGGFDSKLLLSELKKRDYRNLLCIILGTKCTKDAIVAKEIASKLGYEYIYIQIDKQYWKNKRISGEMEEYYKICSDFSSMPYIQGYVIADLIREGKLSKDCVVMTGNSGDVVEGNNFSGKFEKDKEYSIQDVKQHLIYLHYMLNGRKKAKEAGKRLDIYSYSTVKYSKINGEVAEDIIERFNWRERQSKYIIHDVRNYDYVVGNIEWLLPLWDNTFVDFWLTVPFELRRMRRLYYMYLGEDKLPSANDESVFRRILNYMKKSGEELFYPFYIVKGIINYYLSRDYFYATYGLLSGREFYKILFETCGYRKPQSQNIVRKIVEKYQMRNM